MRNKYHNRQTVVDNVTFASRRESQRYSELKLLERAGHIRDIELQPRYDLIVNGHKCGFYKADFRYIAIQSGETIVEDVKSPATKTQVYRLKRKLVKALYNFDIVEV